MYRAARHAALAFNYLILSQNTLYFAADVSAVSVRRPGGRTGSEPVSDTAAGVPCESDAVHRAVRAIRLRSTVRRFTLLRHRFQTYVLC